MAEIKLPSEHMTEQEYRSHPAISKTDLDHIAISPAHFKAYKAEPPKPTPALIFGSAFHTLILEPDLFPTLYAEAPDIDKRTKAGKEVWAELEASGRTVLSVDTMATLRGMRESVMAKKVARNLIETSQHEVPMFATYPDYDIPMKSKPDCWNPDLEAMADLKTTTDASFEGFQRSLFNYRYDVQAAYYSDVAMYSKTGTVKAFVFIAVEKTPPYAVAIFGVNNEVLNFGMLRYRMNLKTYRECLDSDKWYAYDDNIQPMGMPPWAYNKEVV